MTFKNFGMLFLFLLGCSSTFAMERTLTDSAQAIVSDQHCTLKSPYAKLIITLSMEDLPDVRYLMQSDLFKIFHNNPSRHLFFIKAYVDALSANPGNKYTRTKLGQRLAAYEANLKEGTARTPLNDNQEQLDQMLNFQRLFENLGSFKEIVSGMIIDYLGALVVGQRTQLPPLQQYDCLSSRDIALYMFIQKANKLGEVQYLLIEALTGLYKAIHKDVDDGHILESIRRSAAALEVWFKQSALYTNHADESRDLRELPEDMPMKNFLGQFSDEGLKRALFLLSQPYINPVVTKGLLIKLFLTQSDGPKTLGNERNSLIRRLLYILKRNMPDGLRRQVEEHLSHFCDQLKGALKSRAPEWDGISLKSIAPERKQVVYELLKLLYTQQPQTYPSPNSPSAEKRTGSDLRSSSTPKKAKHSPESRNTLSRSREGDDRYRTSDNGIENRIPAAESSHSTRADLGLSSEIFDTLTDMFRPEVAQSLKSLLQERTKALAQVKQLTDQLAQSDESAALLRNQVEEHAAAYDELNKRHELLQAEYMLLNESTQQDATLLAEVKKNVAQLQEIFKDAGKTP